VVLEEQWVGDQRWLNAKGGGAITWRGFFWWPLPHAEGSADVPDGIRKAFAEAVTCLAAGCPRAAAVMARRALEAVCAHQGIKEATLAKSVDSLVASGKLVPSLAEWAKEVRLVGNKGAHFDALDEIDANDVSELLSFLEELLKFMYELPADLLRRRNKASK
jgi:hypothetical protein